MFAFIFGIVGAVLESDGADVCDSDADSDGRQQHERDHQDYGHVASSDCAVGSRIDVCGIGVYYWYLRDAQCCMINVRSLTRDPVSEYGTSLKDCKD